MFLNEIPSPSISFVDLGPFRVHFYALFIILGIFVAAFMAHSRLKARGARGLEVTDIALWAVPFGIIGGRIVHVLTHLGDYFGEGKDPMAVFRIWEGGLAIYGALIFGFLGAWLGSRSTGIRLLSFADAVAPGILIAQAIGRLGNYFNQELFGAPTTLPWGLAIEPGNPALPAGLPIDTLFHPTFAYEALLNLLGAAILLLLDRKFELRWGKLFALYLVWYSSVRFFIEDLRIDPSEVLLGLRTFQWFAVGGVLIGLALFLVQKRMHPGLEPSVYFREPDDIDAQIDELEPVASIRESAGEVDSNKTKAQ